MNNPLNVNTDSELSAEEATQLEAAIRQMFEEIERVDARIESNQADIERLKAETQAMLAELRAAA